MASGGMYDHLGGGFARYSVDGDWLVPHFEKMLYDQALLAARLPPRLAGHRRGRGTSRCSTETIDYVLPRPPPPRRRLLLLRGRRLRGRRGQVLRLDARTSCATLLGDDADAAIEWWGVTAGGQLRGREHPAPAGAGRPAPARRRSSEARRRAVRGPGEAGPARPRRQGAHRVERPVPRRRWPRRPPPPAATTGWPTPGPTASSCSANLRRRRRPLAAVVAGRQAGPPPGLRRRLRRPGRRLHPPGRGHRRGPLDRRGPRRPPTPCSSCSGTTRPAGCSPPAHDAERAHHPPQGPDRQRHAVGQRHRRRRPAPPRRPDRRRRATRERAEDILRLLAGAGRPAPDRLQPHLLAAVDLRRRPASPRSPSSATAPTWSPRCSAGTCPTRCWPGASRGPVRCARAARTASPTCAGARRASRRCRPPTSWPGS